MSLLRLTMCVALVAGCGGGSGLDLPLDGSGGSGAGAPGEGLRLQLLEEAAYLALPGQDVRTRYRVRFELSTPEGEPVAGLGTDRFRFVRDGNESTSENAQTPSDAVRRVDLALCLDNSKSLAFAPDGTPTPENVDGLRAAAIEFLNAVVGSAKKVRIYRFSTSSRTEKIGEYLSDGQAWAADATTGRTPQEDVTLSIGPDATLDAGTALFQSVRQALVEDAEGDDLTIVFSDGIEEGSAPGAESAVVDMLAREERVIHALGVGSADPGELQRLAVHGSVLVGTSFDSLDSLFAQVAKRVESVYTVIYDTPLLFGDHSLELIVEDEEGRAARHTTTLRAGVDLATRGYHTPLTPGSTWTLIEPQTAYGQRTFTVLGLDQSASHPETDVLHFAISDSANPGSPPSYVAPWGLGAIVDLPGVGQATFVPPLLSEGVTWRSAEGTFEFRVTEPEDVEVRGVLYEACMRVEVYRVAAGQTEAMGTTWIHLGYGPVKTLDGSGAVQMELAEPPAVVTAF